MFSKMVCTGLLVMGCMSASSAAFADEERGATFGLGVGQSRISFDDELLGDLNGDDFAFKIFGSYRFTGNLALEMAYVDGGEPSDMISGVQVSERVRGIEASAIWSSSTAERFGMFLRAGVMSWDANIELTDGFDTLRTSDDGTDISAGVGAWLRTGNAQLRLEYGGVNVEDMDVRLVTMTMAWMF